MSLFIIKIGTLGYPIVVGMMIEIVLEKAAKTIVEENLVPNIKKKRNRMKAVRKRGIEPLEPGKLKRILVAYKEEVSMKYA